MLWSLGKLVPTSVPALVVSNETWLAFSASGVGADYLFSSPAKEDTFLHTGISSQRNMTIAQVYAPRK